ncbi:MAG: hypothetical protein BGO01_03880 [Armatimonadetes bacterium 55-13]|nr:MAG: hypothetical protein BGO01_03880 [Armatimonadetes bacterium 55-13]
MKKLLATDNSGVLTFLRVVLGLVMLPHGLQKVFGLFGGLGFSGQMQAMTQGMHIPALFALLAILTEFLGALGLITGTLTRLSAFGTAMVMIVAIVMVHQSNGFFMNWFGNQKGEGFEYHLLALGLALPLLVKGGGAWSVDGKIVPQEA